MQIALRFKQLYKAIVAFLCLGTLTGYFGAISWIPDLANHFRYSLLKGIFLCLLIGLFLGLIACLGKSDASKKARKHWLYTVALLALCGYLNIHPMLAYLQKNPQAPVTATDQKNAFKLLHLNVYIHASPHQPLLDTIDKNAPDVVDFVEYGPRWPAAMEKVHAMRNYPYRAVYADSEAAVYSKFPILDQKLFYTHNGQGCKQPVCGLAVANLLVHLKVHDKIVSLLVVHPVLPTSALHVQTQHGAFEYWAAHRAAFGENLIIAGDFNSTPWTTAYQRLLRDTGLRDAGIGFGVNPTWPAYLPFGKTWKLFPSLGVLGMPIDHILVSPRFQILHYNALPPMGSDHVPVLSTILLK